MGGPDELAIVFSGGGASAAYQAGYLRSIARRHPRLRARILTGVSAGAVNAAVLAGLSGTFLERVEGLCAAWRSLEPEVVYKASGLHLLERAFRYGLRLVSGRASPVPRPQSLLDTAPLRAFLQGLIGDEHSGIAGLRDKIDRGELRGLALSASSYRSGRTVTWLSEQSAQAWTGPHREMRPARLSIDHIMASTALPMLFPAVAIDGEWFGDGSIGFTSPFSPAVHLGASHVLAITLRRPQEEAAAGGMQTEYPPPAQVAGALLGTLFYEHSHSDALRLSRINSLLEQIPAAERQGLRKLELLVTEPQTDMAAMAMRFEPRLPRTLRFLMRGLGTKEGGGGELLSLLMFQSEYLGALIEAGELDAELRAAELDALVGGFG